MFFLFILIILVAIGFAIYTSRVGIEIKNLIFDTELPKGEKINKDSQIFVISKLFLTFFNGGGWQIFHKVYLIC